MLRPGLTPHPAVSLEMGFGGAARLVLGWLLELRQKLGDGDVPEHDMPEPDLIEDAFRPDSSDMIGLCRQSQLWGISQCRTRSCTTRVFSARGKWVRTFLLAEGSSFPFRSSILQSYQRANKGPT